MAREFTFKVPLQSLSEDMQRGILSDLPDFPPDGDIVLSEGMMMVHVDSGGIVEVDWAEKNEEVGSLVQLGHVGPQGKDQPPYWFRGNINNQERIKFHDLSTWYMRMNLWADAAVRAKEAA